MDIKIRFIRITRDVNAYTIDEKVENLVWFPKQNSIASYDFLLTTVMN